MEIITLDFPFLTSLSPPSFGSPFPAIFSRTVSLGGLNTVASSPGTRRTAERSIDIFGSSCPNQAPGSRQTSLLNPDLSTRLCLSHDFLFLLSFFSRSPFYLLSTFGILAQNRFSPLRERITEEHLAQCLVASQGHESGERQRVCSRDRSSYRDTRNEGRKVGFSMDKRSTCECLTR